AGAAATSGAGASGPVPGPSSEAGEGRRWEIEALREEERRAEAVVADLSFQIEALQAQLDKKNEAHERELVKVAGALEGSLSALRRLENELVRTIDDGIDVLQRV